MELFSVVSIKKVLSILIDLRNLRKRLQAFITCFSNGS